jgi:Gram-negative bacterial TonB protein C-terminal
MRGISFLLTALLFTATLGAQTLPSAQSGCCKADRDNLEIPCLSSSAMKEHVLRIEEPKPPCCGKGLREQGIVVWSVKVSSEGQVLSFHVLEGKPLGVASMSSVISKWKFRPAYVHGQKREFCGPLVIHYRVRDDSAKATVLSKAPH